MLIWTEFRREIWARVEVGSEVVRTAKRRGPALALQPVKEDVRNKELTSPGSNLSESTEFCVNSVKYCRDAS